MPRVPSKGIQVVEYPHYHRYKIDGQWVIGVTTALKGIPKDALKFWAAGVVADYALSNLRQVSWLLESAGYGPAWKMLTDIPNEKRDSAAVRGLDVHALAERYIRDEEIEVSDELMPYVLGYAAYISDFNPTPIYEELVVANREHGYAGRLDSIQDVPTLGLIQVDYKTSKGVYGEHALQCAAYEHAEVYVDAEGNEQPMPKLAGSYVLHIMPNTYDLIPVITDDAAFEKFLTAMRNYKENVQSNKLDKLLGEPVPPPNKEEAA
jgi:hypothetical protein